MLTGLPGRSRCPCYQQDMDLSETINLEDLDLPEGVKPIADDNHAVAMVAPKAGRVKAEEDKKK